MTTSQAISTIALLREAGDDCEQTWNDAFQQLIDEDVVDNEYMVEKAGD